MKRVIAIAVVLELVIAGIALNSTIKEFLWTHPWWHSLLVAIPTLALPILAFWELRHSGEANMLRAEANGLRADANILRAQNAKLSADVDRERNEQLQQIARNTDRPPTKAEINSAILRKHLGRLVPVSEGQGTWPGTPELVEVSEGNVVTLFVPSSVSSSTAFCVQVDCGDLEIAEIPQGSCPLRIRILKRYGVTVDLGQITTWEDRFKPAAAPTFVKGGTAYWASYTKPGLPGSRSIHAYTSKDGGNLFLLEASTGEKVVGDNKEISKRFMVLQVEYEAEGFGRGNCGTGNTSHPLFIH